jgi:hypothetical protein
MNHGNTTRTKAITSQSLREGTHHMGSDEENEDQGRTQDRYAGKFPVLPREETEFNAAQVAQLEAAMFGRKSLRQRTIRARTRRMYLVGREMILRATPPDEDQDFDESTIYGRIRAFFARSWWARTGLGLGAVLIAGLWCGITLGVGR